MHRIFPRESLFQWRPERRGFSLETSENSCLSSSLADRPDIERLTVSRYSHLEVTILLSSYLCITSLSKSCQTTTMKGMKSLELFYPLRDFQISEPFGGKRYTEWTNSLCRSMTGLHCQSCGCD